MCIIQVVIFDTVLDNASGSHELGSVSGRQYVMAVQQEVPDIGAGEKDAGEPGRERRWALPTAMLWRSSPPAAPSGSARERGSTAASRPRRSVGLPTTADCRAGRGAGRGSCLVGKPESVAAASPFWFDLARSDVGTTSAPVVGVGAQRANQPEPGAEERGLAVACPRALASPAHRGLQRQERVSQAFSQEKKLDELYAAALPPLPVRSGSPSPGPPPARPAARRAAVVGAFRGHAPVMAGGLLVASSGPPPGRPNAPPRAATASGAKASSSLRDWLLRSRADHGKTENDGLPYGCDSEDQLERKLDLTRISSV